MKAVMLMFDSLNREMLEPYGCDRQRMSESLAKSLVYTRYLSSIRSEYFLQNSSRDLCVLYPLDFTSIGHILFLFARRKSIS